MTGTGRDGPFDSLGFACKPSRPQAGIPRREFLRSPAMSQSEDVNTPTYRIGAVSRLTQIPAETLRVWERRYHVVEPRRGGGQTRLYDRNDVERLTVIKQLVDRGHAISTVASLDLEELKTRLQEHHLQGIAAVDPEYDGKEIATLVVGETVATMVMEGEADMDGVEIVGTAFDASDVGPDAATRKPRVIVLECPTIDHRTSKTTQLLLRRTGALRVIVVYGFGTRDNIQRLSTGRVRVLRGPMNNFELRRAIIESESARSDDQLRTRPVGDEAEEIPGRRFTNAHLARLSTVSSAVECECPQHLVGIITQLVAFEEYSQECEDRNDKDASIHAMLRRTTAQSRAKLEDAMARLMEAEGIVL